MGVSLSRQTSLLVVCSSEDLDLGDVMDIELEFPSLTESQDAPVRVHGSSVQVSFCTLKTNLDSFVVVETIINM